MKKILTAMIFLLASSGLAAETVSAKIEGNSCARQKGFIVVPSGKVATAFRIQGLGSGVSCYGGSRIEEKGFGIKDNNERELYRYSENKRGEVYEAQGPLGSFSLNPGRYSLYVDGGNGAQVSLSYSLQ